MKRLFLSSREVAKYFSIDELPEMFCRQHEEIKDELIKKHSQILK